MGNDFAPEPEFFFKKLEKWQKWLQDELPKNESKLKIARTRPAGVHHVSGLHLDGDGRVWYDNGHGNWFSLVRSGEDEFATYKRTPAFSVPVGSGGNHEINADGLIKSVRRPNGSWLDLVAHSDDDQEFEKDWAWELIPEDNPRRPSHPASYLYEGTVLDCKVGLRLVEILLERRPDIISWMMNYAQSQGNLRAEKDLRLPEGDWGSLLHQFAPGLAGLRVPDNSELKAALSAVLDQIACNRQVRAYIF
ncbi:MAG: hypothetical protein ABIJ46_01515 [bacterium]